MASAPCWTTSSIATDPASVTPSIRLSWSYPRTPAQGGQTIILPPELTTVLIISLIVGSSGFRRACSVAPLRTQSTPELTRNIVTSIPLATPPLATLHATDERSSLNPLVTITTSFFLSSIVLSQIYLKQPQNRHLGVMTQEGAFQVPEIDCFRRFSGTAVFACAAGYSRAYGSLRGCAVPC